MSRFLSKFKGGKERRDDLTPDSSSSFSSNNPYQYTQSEPPAYEPPPGPPPSHNASSPQTHDEVNHNSDDNPPPYHDWTSVPDTALLPPPPAIANDYSSTSNATYDDAAMAHAWCARNHVYNPTMPNFQLIEAIQAGQHDLDPPPNCRGTVAKTTPDSHPSSFNPNSYGATPMTIFQISTTPTPDYDTSAYAPPKSSFSRFMKTPPVPPILDSPADQTYITRLPLYFANLSSPLSPHVTSRKPAHFTAYFEIRPTKFVSPDSTVSLGFVSKPYPPNRQPGWHRASLAVHSDDGNRYVNDPWGGREFTSAFQVGEILGLAIQISPEDSYSSSGGGVGGGGSSAAEKAGKGRKTLQSEREVHSSLPKCKTKVYFTRNGVVQGSWDVDEERDAEKDEGIAGLWGEVDLYAAVGTFGNVEVEVRFYQQGDGFVAPPSR